MGKISFLTMGVCSSIIIYSQFRSVVVCSLVRWNQSAKIREKEKGVVPLTTLHFVVARVARIVHTCMMRGASSCLVYIHSQEWASLWGMYAHLGDFHVWHWWIMIPMSGVYLRESTSHREQWWDWPMSKLRRNSFEELKSRVRGSDEEVGSWILFFSLFFSFILSPFTHSALWECSSTPIWSNRASNERSSSKFWSKRDFLQRFSMQLTPKVRCF